MKSEHGNSVLAKLLAAENITVVQENCKTASFNVRDRILTLPMWSDMSKDTEDHLTGHEVGHALFTPEEGWHDAVCDAGPGYKSFLNVVEDARIEKLIQRKFPGLRTSFIRSYRDLLAAGFFGKNIEQINKTGLIDRINTYFKCGSSIGVQFARDEQQWIAKVGGTETWEEVVEVTDELFAFCKKQKEEQQKQDAKDDQQAQEDGDDESEDDLGGEDEEGETSDWDLSDLPEDGEGEGEDGDPTSDDAGGEEEEESDEEGEDDAKESGETGGKSSADEPRSETDAALRDAIDQQHAPNADRQVYNLNLPAQGLFENQFYGYKTLLRELTTGVLLHETPEENAAKHSDSPDEYEIYRRKEEKANRATLFDAGTEQYNKWYATAKKSIALMVKEFEMKKSATQHARAKISKTGTLDTLKMNHYRTTDDIFKKVTTVPDGKNHGFLMILDLSSSMWEQMFPVVKQTLLMVNFCRAIGVPFRVYGFTDNLSGGQSRDWDNMPMDTILTDPRLRMLEIFNERMTKTEMTTMAKFLIGGAYSQQRNNRRAGYNPARIFSLGGTPLDSAIIAMMPVAVAFRKQYKLDKLNTILLTDGQSHPAYVNNGLQGNTRLNWLMRNDSSVVTIRSPINQKVYRVLKTQRGGDNATARLLEIFKDVTGSVMLGYFVVDGGRSSVLNACCYLAGTYIDREPVWKAIKSGAHAVVPTPGYDKMYVLWGKNLEEKTSKMDEIVAGAKKGAISRAFASAATSSKQTRKLLQDIVSQIA